MIAIDNQLQKICLFFWSLFLVHSTVYNNMQLN